VVHPPELNIQFSLTGGDRYALPFPKFPKIEAIESGELTGGMQNPPDFDGLIARLEGWVKELSGKDKLVLCKDKPPTATEERLLAETRKTLFIPATTDLLPRTDPKKRLVTEDIFKRFLESVGVEEKNLNEVIVRYIRSKTEGGIFSDAWVPVLFQEYVIGYIHVWLDKEGLPPLTAENLDTLYQFARSLTAALRANGYFDAAKLTNKPFTGAILDVSASGLLFSYPNADLTSAMPPGEELAVTLSPPNADLTSAMPPGEELAVTLSAPIRPVAVRTINATARIVRRFTDQTINYFGCQFLDIAPEDIRFLFEFIYGRPFTDADAGFITGNV
jgi:hypothetical protein